MEGIYMRRLVELMVDDGLMASVWCMAYNHEKYIRDAIEGFLMQKTNFRFEIVLHDDASTDGTAGILKEYEEKYPELIRVIYEDDNQYIKYEYKPQFSFGIMRRELKGRYIAWCEGDDYWTDPDKLQIQIDYMESHPDCVMTVHDAVRMNCRTGDKKAFGFFEGERDILPVDAITLRLPTASYICRREMLDMGGFFLETDVGDTPLQLYCITNGKIHYFDRVMSVYRYLNENSWSVKQRNNLSDRIKHLAYAARLLEQYNKYTGRIYEGCIRKILAPFTDAILGIEWSVGQFCGLCEELDKASDYKMHKQYMVMSTIFKQISGVDLAEKNKHVLIYGAGNFAGVLAEKFTFNGIQFEGFIVSDNQAAPDSYLGKKVWKICELPFNKEDTGVAIAVRKELKEEILKSLQDNGIKNYIYPFEIEAIEWI